MMHGSETWAAAKGEQDLLERREMRLLRWMMGTKRIKRDETVEMDETKRIHGRLLVKTKMSCHHRSHCSAFAHSNGDNIV